MTRSRGQFDTRHGGESDETARDDEDTGRRVGFDGVPAWVSFHRVEFLVVVWVLLGAGFVPLAFGLGSILHGAEGVVPGILQTIFWVTLVVAVPLLWLALAVHAIVDAYRVGIADGEVTSWGRVVLRCLQTTAALVFALGVVVILQDTTPANAEFNPAALVSAFFLLAGLAGMVAFVAVDGLVRLARRTW